MESLDGPPQNKVGDPVANVSIRISAVKSNLPDTPVKNGAAFDFLKSHVLNFHC